MADQRDRKVDYDPAKPSQYTIAQFGGVKAFSDLTGVPTSTAWDWWERGRFPSCWRGLDVHPWLIGLAAQANVKLEPADTVMPRSGAG